jgi:hypothetical protein
MVSRHVTYTAAFAHFFPGAFIKDLRPSGRAVTLFTNFVTYRF